MNVGTKIEWGIRKKREGCVLGRSPFFAIVQRRPPKAAPYERFQELALKRTITGSTSSRPIIMHMESTNLEKPE